MLYLNYHSRQARIDNSVQSFQSKSKNVRKQIRLIKGLLFLLLSLTSCLSYGENNFSLSESDFVFSNNDSTSKALKKQENYRARKATLMSTVLPGLGQCYNKQYWKVPVLYASITGLTYLWIENNKEYKKFVTAFKLRSDSLEDTVFPNYTDEGVVSEKNRFQKYRDLSAIGIGIIYILNVVDANVSAHLLNFETKINDDLSLNIKPYTYMSVLDKPQINAGFTFQFKIGKVNKTTMKIYNY